MKDIVHDANTLPSFYRRIYEKELKGYVSPVVENVEHPDIRIYEKELKELGSTLSTPDPVGAHVNVNL